MGLPTKQRFFYKFLLAITEDIDVKNAYFERFGVVRNKDTPPEKIGCQLIDKLSYYGGYETRRKLIESVPITPSDLVLDIGPEMGMESFLLAETYDKVLVAEPDATTSDLLIEVAKYYRTEDGRQASEVLDVRRCGIVPAGAKWSRTNAHEKPSNPVSFDARGAQDIKDVFSLHLADRVVCHHIGSLMPAEPQLLVLLSALSLVLKPKGVITWCDELSELSGLVVDYAKYQNISFQRKKYYKCYNCVTECSIREIKNRITELLPDFNITFRVFRKTGQLLSIARRN